MFLTPSVIKTETVEECNEDGWHGYSNDYKVTVTALYMDTSDNTTTFI